MAMLAAVWFHVQPGFAQTAEEFKALRDEVKAVKDGQAAIQKDLQEIKKLLASRPAQPAEFKEAIINIDGAPIKGDKNAKLVLMEFSDYQ
jgi:hypothetical protein